MRIIVIIIGLATLCPGCSQLDFYLQAARGQLEILAARQPIDRLVADPATPEVLKGKLRLVQAAREFAADTLGLPAEGQFQRYADLKRPYVAWNVFAAPEFSLTPHTWCYPLVGCAAYRGYFSAAAAKNHADLLAKQGLDVHLGGVPAYSTLGWFDDPLLSSVIHWQEADLAALVFHELAHRVLYLPDDTTFNESFATAVEQEGVRRWLSHQKRPEVYADYLQKKQRQEELVNLVLAHRGRLAAIYHSDLAPADMRARKEVVFTALRMAYGDLKQRWNDDGRFDGWFRAPLNNAWLVPIGAYHDLVPVFTALLARENGDLSVFYARCRVLGEKSPEERKAFLMTLLEGGKPSR